MDVASALLATNDKTKTTGGSAHELAAPGGAWYDMCHALAAPEGPGTEVAPHAVAKSLSQPVPVSKYWSCLGISSLRAEKFAKSFLLFTTGL